MPALCALVPCGHPPRSCARNPECLAEIVVEQVDVGVEREASRVVAEPALHLPVAPALPAHAGNLGGDGQATPT